MMKSHLQDDVDLSYLDIKSFKCNYDGKSFGRFSTWKLHYRTYIGKKEL